VSAKDSLVLAGMVELLRGGQVSAHPMCPGAIIVLQPGFSRGAGQPNTETVASILLDGERPTGRRTSNREIQLQCVVWAPSRAVLNGARELLLELVDQPNFTLQWTPDPEGGTPLPLIFECFRATQASTVFDQDAEDELVGFVTLTFPALPFGRSDDFTTLPFPSPAVGWSTPPPPLRVDNFAVVSSSTQTSAWSQSTQAPLDSFSARWAAIANAAPSYTHTLAGPVDLTGLDRLTFNFGLGTSSWTAWHNGRVTFALTLTDSHGYTTAAFGGHHWVSAGNDPDHPFFQPVTFAIPGDPALDLTTVTGWSLTAWRRLDWLGRLRLDADAYINGLTASASAAASIPLVRGTTYRIGAAGGTARTLMSAQFQPPLLPVLTPQVLSFTTPGPWSWIPPIGATIQKMLVQGASGRGGGRSSAGAAAGAGAGASVTVTNYPCTAGQAITGNIGAGGSSSGFPVLVASYPVYQDGANANPMQTPSFTPGPGEVLVVKAQNGYSVASFGTPVGGGLTWTSRAVSTGSGNRAQLYTAVAGASPGAMTVTVTHVGYPTAHGMVVERWSNAKLAASPAVVQANGTGAPSATITTVAANSVATWVNTDWTAQTGARAYRSGAVEEAYHYSGGTYYTGYWAYQTAAAAGAQTVGLTSPTQTWGLAGIEIQALNTGGLTDGQPTTADGVKILAAGGQSVADNSNTPGAGGTVAACTVPAGGTARRGGNGAAGSTTGGGGGGGADDTGQGGDASGGTAGAAGGPNAGAGGAGGAAGGNNPGGAGVAPAGAGAGAFSTGGAAAGGASANGKVTITYLAPLTPFRTLLVHAPGYDAPATFSPLIPVGSGLDPPDGREYAIPSPYSGLNARYYGTYSVVVFLSNVDSLGSARTHTVTFRQYDYPGGPSTSRSVSRVLTPSAEVPPIANGVVIIDTITLPVRDIADDQTAAYTTAAFTSTNSADRALDVAVVDVTGQVLLLNVASGSGFPTYWWDMPDADRDWGRILASTYDRAQASSVMDSVLALSGGPLMVDPYGPGWLLVYSPDAGAPSLTAGFWPRWRDSRLA
jgi:hypothetical protein